MERYCAIAPTQFLLSVRFDIVAIYYVSENIGPKTRHAKPSRERDLARILEKNKTAGIGVPTANAP